MATPLNASATNAGALLSSSSFEIPPYQREYSWLEDEVSEFWNDLRNALGDDSYFLGLVILTEQDGYKQVVDGQQRLLTLTLLAAALFHEASTRGRKALAERIEADFLRTIDYDTDETNPRVTLSDEADNKTLQTILSAGTEPAQHNEQSEDSLSVRMQKAFNFLRQRLREDLARDPFKRLGIWTDFITNRLYFAVFLHPDTASAYRVFEVINTRGLELTTADLLKNYVLSQTPAAQRDALYREWQSMAKQFSISGANTFVQYIRHAVTVAAGHVLPKDLYAFLAGKSMHGPRQPPTISGLVNTLKEYFPLYLQMVDPSLAGPATPDMLKIFASLNSLGVISVRPILLAIAATDNSIEGMKFILQLVVRRIVVGNLGTGNVERKFGEAARRVFEAKTWQEAKTELLDLNPAPEEFKYQLYRRSFNKGVLSFIRRSIVKNSITPDTQGTLHFIFPRQAEDWDGFSDEDASFWTSTIGNTFLSYLDKRPPDADSWIGFKNNMLKTAVSGEWIEKLESHDAWTSLAVEQVGESLAAAATDIWYDEHAE